VSDVALSLAELLTAIVDDLREVERQRVAQGQPGRVAVDRVELELKATTTKEGHAGLKFHVVGADFGGRAEAVSTVRVTLAPPPATVDASPFLFSEGDRGTWAGALRLEVVRTALADLLEASQDPAMSREALVLRLERLRQQLDEDATQTSDGT
jgi:hypothetical protein